MLENPPVLNLAENPGETEQLPLQPNFRLFATMSIGFGAELSPALANRFASFYFEDLPASAVSSRVFYFIYYFFFFIIDLFHLCLFQKNLIKNCVFNRTFSQRRLLCFANVIWMLLQRKLNSPSL